MAEGNDEMNEQNAILLNYYFLTLSLDSKIRFHLKK